MMETEFRSIKRQHKSSSNQQRDSQPAPGWNHEGKQQTESEYSN